MKRTNPEKGLHVDLKWREITWEEAYAEIVPRLKKILDDNPNKLFFQWTTSRGNQYRAFGFIQFIYALCGRMPDVMGAGGGGLHCGKSAHSAAGAMYSSWSIVPDFRYVTMPSSSAAAITSFAAGLENTPRVLLYAAIGSGLLGDLATRYLILRCGLYHPLVPSSTAGDVAPGS